MKHSYEDKEATNRNGRVFNMVKEDLKNKYTETRKLFSNIYSNMIDYINSEDYLISDKIKHIDEPIVLNELIIFNNNILKKSLTKTFIEKGLYKDNGELEMLKAMDNSSIDLFRIIKCDKETGFITYENIFTKELINVLDPGMSMVGLIDNKELFVYNRIIKYDNITFGTGLPFIIDGNSDSLKRFIKNDYQKDAMTKLTTIFNIANDKENSDVLDYYY